METILTVLDARKYKVFGGAELATKHITNILAINGFKIIIAACPLTATPNNPNIEVIRIPRLCGSSKLHLWFNILNTKVKNTLSSLINKADIVYIPRLAYPVIPLAKKQGKKVILHLHDYQPISFTASMYPEDGAPSALTDAKKTFKYEVLEHKSYAKALASTALTPLNYLARKWAAQADKIICVSKRQAEIIARNMPEARNKIISVYNPLPLLTAEKTKYRKPTFTYTGGKSYVKGYKIALSAALKTAKKKVDAKFIFVGTWNGQKYSTSKIEFRSRMPYQKIIELYSKSTSIIIPSIWEEPLPYTVLEAMAVGTIPIASNIGGIPEIVKETFAEKMLFKPKDADSLADRIEEAACLSREDLADIGSKLRTAVYSKFGENVVTPEIIKAFKDSHL
ncbi:MAG: glycosyltransferase family 4 protein [Thermoproteales archaeon]|nr:glycosyltransferase family 4 protein [Thermoproteales archaeon]